MKVAILGCGYMGTALLRGLLQKGDAEHTYTAHVTSAASAQRIELELGNLAKDRVNISYGDDTIVAAATGADVVLLGVQPKDLGAVLAIDGLAKVIQGSTIISMLAGVSVQGIKEAVLNHVSTADPLVVARVIPTLGAIRGDSVTLLVEPDPNAGPEREEQFGKAEKLLEQVGSIVRVPEALMNSATALGAAVHALSIVAIDTATDASVAAGMPRDVARAIAAESLRSGSGLMCGTGSMSPEQVKAAMSTPAGITLNAVVNLDVSVRPGVASSVKSAIRYASGMND